MNGIPLTWETVIDRIAASQHPPFPFHFRQRNILLDLYTIRPFAEIRNRRKLDAIVSAETLHKVVIHIVVIGKGAYAGAVLDFNLLWCLVLVPEVPALSHTSNVLAADLISEAVCAFFGAV